MDVDQLTTVSAHGSPRPILKLATDRNISLSEQCLPNATKSPHSSPTRQYPQQGVKWSMYSQKPTSPPLYYSQPTPPQSPYGQQFSPQPHQTTPPLYYSQTPPLTPRVSQNTMSSGCTSPMAVRSGANTIIINPAGAAPSGCITPVQHQGYNGMSTPSTPGYSSPGRVTPGRMPSGRCTPVFTVAMKKRYVDIMLASTASTVAIDNKIEQAMDLVKSHLMFAVREEVDVLKERIGELMERINHLEYENTVLRKYASPETLQQLQHPSANP